MKRKVHVLAGGVVALLGLAAGQSAFAAKLCLKAANPAGKKVNIQTRMVGDADPCPRGYRTSILGSDLVPAAPTPVSIFGDGSAGAKVVSADEDVESTLDQSNAPNFQFTDVTIAAGKTWTVPSGSVIRCTGTFTNNGTIYVSLGAAGGWKSTTVNNLVFDQGDSPAHPGISSRSAGYGMWTSGLNADGGAGGVAPSIGELSQITRPGIHGGGGGAAGGPDTCPLLLGGSYVSNGGSSGGGAITILCQGGVVNNGTISANGANGEDAALLFPCDNGGGGGGGVVILGSKSSITNTGTIAAQGGNGEAPDANEAGSGGGGGGLIRMISPAVSNTGATQVQGGAGGGAGAAGTVNDGALVFGGGGGGGSAGHGGSGGDVVIGDDSATAPGNGGDGKVIITQADPTGLF